METIFWCHLFIRQPNQNPPGSSVSMERSGENLRFTIGSILSFIVILNVNRPVRLFGFYALFETHLHSSSFSNWNHCSFEVITHTHLIPHSLPAKIIPANWNSWQRESQHINHLCVPVFVNRLLFAVVKHFHWIVTEFRDNLPTAPAKGLRTECVCTENQIILYVYVHFRLLFEFVIITEGIERKNTHIRTSANNLMFNFVR